MNIQFHKKLGINLLGGAAPLSWIIMYLFTTNWAWVNETRGYRVSWRCDYVLKWLRREGIAAHGS
jgi:hypothetical protein